MGKNTEVPIATATSRGCLHGRTAAWRQAGVLMAVGLGICLIILVSCAPRASALTTSPVMTWWSTSPGARFDAATAMAIGADGAVYVAGNQTTAVNGMDMTLVRLGDGGWMRTFDSRAHGWDTASDVLAAPDGSVFVVGTSTRTASTTSRSAIVVIRYASDGRRLWTRRWASDVGSYRAVRALVDAGNHVIVLGQRGVIADGVAPTSTPVLARFTRDGGRMWDLLYGHYRQAEAADICLGVNGSIYTCGLGISSEGRYQGFLLKVSVLGKRQLSATYHPGGATCSFEALAPCPGGGVYVCNRGTDGSSLLRYAPTNIVPTVVVATGGEGSPVFTDVAVDSSGRLDVCGWSLLDSPAPHSAPYIAQFLADGTLLWSVHPGVGSITDGTPQLALTPDDALLTTGVVTPDPSSTSRMIATFCHEPSGTERWSSIWNAPVVGTAWLGLDPMMVGDDRLYVHGTAKRPGNGYDGLVLGYDLAPAAN